MYCILDFPCIHFLGLILVVKLCFMDKMKFKMSWFAACCFSPHDLSYTSSISLSLWLCGLFLLFPHSPVVFFLTGLLSTLFCLVSSSLKPLHHCHPLTLRFGGQQSSTPDIHTHTHTQKKWERDRHVSTADILLLTHRNSHLYLRPSSSRWLYFWCLASSITTSQHMSLLCHLFPDMWLLLAISGVGSCTATLVHMKLSSIRG